MSLVGTRPPTVDEYEQYEIGHRESIKNNKRVEKRKVQFGLRFQK